VKSIVFFRRSRIFTPFNVYPIESVFPIQLGRSLLNWGPLLLFIPACQRLKAQLMAGRWKSRGKIIHLILPAP